MSNGEDTMNVDFTNDNSDKNFENPTLKEVINPQDSGLKELIVNYVGDKLEPEDENITVEMIFKVFAEEFAEFILPLAEENWIRGYEQAFLDIEEGKKLMQQDSPPAKKEKKGGKQKRKS